VKRRSVKRRSVEEVRRVREVLRVRSNE